MQSTSTLFACISTDKESWKFPDNQNGEIKGFNDAGVSTFDGNTLRSMVRESIQNSLDAALQPKKVPVTVEFELFNVDSSDIPGSKDLYYAFRQCQAFAEKGGKAFRFFTRTINDCKKPIPVLRISDHGTTGLRGAETGDLSSDWSRLVKQSGSSSKNDFSGGSFGIGKYASFACSAMRTVFFSSMDDRGIESTIGVARLTSFEHCGSYTSGIGYYSDNDSNNAMFSPLSMPGALHRKANDPGTDIYIIDCMQTENIMRAIRHEALSSFLLSIWKGLLKLKIGDKVIDADNLARIIGELNYEDDDEREIIEYFSLLADGTEGVHVITLDPDEHEFADRYGYPYGSAVLYLKQGERLNRSVMMTRSQGMRLFDQKGISGTIQFTGILMIEGEKMNEDFREMEAPSHDKWEPERAKDSKRAKLRYKDLRLWIRDEVSDAFTREAADQIDAFNAGLYLPVTRDIETTIRNRTPNRKPYPENLLKRKKPKVRKRQLKPRKKAERKEIPEFEEAVRNEAKTDGATSAAKRKGKPKDNENSSANPLVRGLAKENIRLRAMSTPKAGVYRLKFVVPHKVPQFALEVFCKGEIGESDLAIRSASVICGDAQVLDIKENCIRFGECGKGEIIELEITPEFNRYCMFEVDFYASK